MALGPKPRSFGPLTGGAYQDLLNAHFLSQALSTQPVRFTVIGTDGQAHKVTCTLRNNQKDNTALSPYDIEHDQQQQQFLLYHLLQELMNRRGQPLALAPALYSVNEFVYPVKSLVDVNDYRVIPKP